MKQLQIIKTSQPVEGLTNENGDVAINIELGWEYHPTEDKFIKWFSNVLNHELLHRHIQQINGSDDKYFYGEEKIVRLLNKESFTKREKIMYLEETISRMNGG